MLLNEFTSVLQVGSRDDLLREVVGFTRRLGFELVNAMVVVDHLGGELEFLCVNNTPVAYRYVADNRDAGRCDPVMQHCKRHSLPIIWGQDTYTAIGRGDQWETQARFGYCVGIAVALHLPEGKHFLVGVDRDQPLPACRAEITRMAAELQLFAVQAQEPAFRVLLPPSLQPDVPELTPRELESLRWTMEGKTAWELGPHPRHQRADGGAPLEQRHA